MVKYDIYTAKLNSSGSVQNGIRPVIIIQNDVGNRYSSTTIVVPITSSCKKKNQPTHFMITSMHNDSMVLCEQIITIDKNNIGHKIGTLTEEERRKLDECLRISLSL